MLFEPTVVLTRLVISRRGLPVYDEYFHAGVNVIRGENSSGKSTILNAIFYGLGGDLADWSQAALLCTHVTLEVEFNGRKATLRREIAEAAGQPMLVFGGSYEVAIAAPIDEWRKYSYRRSASLESFSQALFRLLGWPEVASEDGGNLTMHQVLRLLYADQLSPVESLFRFERFDPPTLRDAVGRLLCGSYDNTIYEGELEIKALGRQFDAIAGELKSLGAVLGRPEAGFEWILGRRAALEREREELVAQIEEQERRLFEARESDELTLKAQDEAYLRVQTLQGQLADAERERDALNFSIADSGSFISNLEKKVTALNDSALVAEHLGDVRFSTCPACYTPVEEIEASLVHACHLCRTPFDSERSRNRIVAMVNEAGVQLKQSRLLQARRLEKREEVESRLASLQLEWQSASKSLAESRRLPSTSAQERLRSLNRRAGYLDREVEGLTGQEKIVRLITELSEQKEELNRRITTIRSDIDTAKFVLQRRFGQAYDEIEAQIKDLLRNDLRRQDSFENPDSVEFDFGANRISVDGQTYFSASSRVVLKSSFFLGFWAAATRDAAFRHPRFAIIDTIEDKGMEPERSHNFQNQILRKSREAKAAHQIIYATAMISPDLDEEEYTVGKFSTRDDPTLAVEV